MSERYAYYLAALEGRFGAVIETDAQPGFYRVKSSGDFWLPVAIWDEDGITWAMLGKEEPNASGEFVCSTWMRCAKHPVPEKAYRHALATGQWPGEAPAERGMGDNRPPEGHAELVETVLSQSKEASAWLKDREITNQEDADRCEKWANDFLKLKREAEAQHKTEKEPHLKAGREVDGKWKPVIDCATKAARALKDAATAFLVARQNEKRQAAAQSIAKGETAARIETRATTSGTSGRKLSLRTHKFAEIQDWDAAIGFFKGHPELRELVQKLADQCAKIDAPVPGVVFKSEQRAA